MKVVLSEKYVIISAKLGQFLTIILLSFIYLNYVQTFSLNKEITTILSVLIVISISPFCFKEKSLFLVFLFANTLCYAILRGRFTNSAWYLNKSLYWSLAAISYGFLVVKREIIRWTLYIPILIIMLSVIAGAFFMKERIDSGSFFSMNRNTLALSVVVYSIEQIPKY
jgi:hypothetical protein